MLGPFLQQIRAAESLPSLPAVAVQVLQLAQDADVTLEQLTEVIQNDPAMAAKILKVVNSPLFGMSREVASLKQAVTLLGLRKVTILALSFSLVDSLQGIDDASWGLYGFWRRSLTTAIAARLLAGSVGSPLVEEAFVAGLLSDIGIVVAWRCAPELYQPVLDAWSSNAGLIQDIETQEWGCTHATIGRELLKLWRLPEALCEAVGAHHGDGLAELSGAPRSLGSILHCAADLTELFCGGISADQLERVREQCVKETGITPAQLEQSLHDLDEHVHRTASMLSVQVGETVKYAQLQTDAAMIMADLSIQAETERDAANRRAQQARQEAHRLNLEKAALEEAASTDALTRLANRTTFDKQLREEIRRAREQHYSLGLIFMDLDSFKKLNDEFGHQAGDAVLRCVGGRLRDAVKGLGLAARYGGEEFVVMMAGRAAEDVRSTAEAIRRRMESRAVEYDGRELKVTASLGVACVEGPCEALTSEYLIEQADQQLYRAKREGRNRVAMAEKAVLV